MDTELECGAVERVWQAMRGRAPRVPYTMTYLEPTPPLAWTNEGDREGSYQPQGADGGRKNCHWPAGLTAFLSNSSEPRATGKFRPRFEFSPSRPALATAHTKLATANLSAITKCTRCPPVPHLLPPPRP